MEYNALRQSGVIIWSQFSRVGGRFIFFPFVFGPLPDEGMPRRSKERFVTGLVGTF